VIGNGNVALDVARILAVSPAVLARTDIADHALVALDRSRIEEVVVIGRRGPEQATFTHPELRQLGELSNADVVVDPGEVSVPSEFRAVRPSKTVERNLALLEHYSSRPSRGHSRRVAIRFLLSPTRILGDGRVEAIELERNRLSRAQDGSLRAEPTGARAVVRAGLVLRAVGYRGEPIPGVPFDDKRGVIANVNGRVLGPDGQPTREYVVGWAKRGPSGVVGTNKKCAMDTVRVLTQDMVAGLLRAPEQREPAIEAFLRSRQPDLITWADWDTIDRHEREQGQRVGSPRVKLTRVSDMIDVVAASHRLSA
jgi:ferredoxin--NADP+ reductase